MNCTLWNFIKCNKLRFGNNLTPKRFIFVNAIQNRNVERKDNQVLTSPQYFIRNFTFLKTCLNPISNEMSYRKYSKKKKPVQETIEDEESESEEEENDAAELDDQTNVISKNVPSLRLDSILKAGLGVAKKRIEKEFYASNIRLNGERVTKKSDVLQVDDEIDLVNRVAPENSRFLYIHRVYIKSIGKVTGAATYHVKLQVFKSLLIENYQEPWAPVKDDSE